MERHLRYSFVETPFFPRPMYENSSPRPTRGSILFRVDILPGRERPARIKLSSSFRRALTKIGCLYEIKGGYSHQDIVGLACLLLGSGMLFYR